MIGPAARRALASLLLLGVAATATAILADAIDARSRFAALQAALYAGALALVGRAAWGRPHPLLALGAVLVPPALLFGVVQQLFGQVDLLALAHHARSGITLRTLASVLKPILVVAGSLLALLAAAHHLGRLWRRPGGLAAAAALALALANPGLGPLARSLLVTAGDLDLAGRVASPAPRAGPAPAGAPHVVLLYLEGFERAFADRGRFGEAYAPLERLAAEGLEFTGVEQAAGTSWTAAGLVATQCGLPLLPLGATFGYALDGEAAILPGHACLGDVLAARGYEATLVMGGEAGFGGIGAFHEGHGFGEVVDFDALRAPMPPLEAERATAGWVVDDEAVFAAARARLAAGVAGGRPQLLAVHGYGPHGLSDNLLSRSCAPGGQAVLGDDLAGAASCLSAQAEAFVRWALAAGSETGRGVLVAVMSDHLNHYFRTARAGAPRRNTVLLLGAGVAAPGTNGRRGTMMDVYPTLLDVLGLGGPDGRGGLGVSLLREAPTLVEEVGLPRLDAHMAADPALRREVWRDAS